MSQYSSVSSLLAHDSISDLTASREDHSLPVVRGSPGLSIGRVDFDVCMMRCGGMTLVHSVFNLSDWVSSELETSQQHLPFTQTSIYATAIECIFMKCYMLD